MRTTIRIDDHLLGEVKRMAMASNTTLSAFIESALKEVLYKRQQKEKKAIVKLVTFKGRGLKHGVDLDDTASLLDIMESK